VTARRAGALVLTAMLAVATSLASSPAVAGSNDWVRVGDDRVLHLTGHGYGHGHGMSQYGAEGAARAGRSYKHILSFYYPGTNRVRVDNGIRVLISADTDDDVVVKPAAGLFVRDTKDGKKFSLPRNSEITAWRLSALVGDPSATKVQMLRSGSWRRYRLPGRTDFDGTGEFRARGALTLVLPGGGTRVYRDTLRAARPAAGSSSRATVNVLPLQKYVKGVVAAEMPASWHQAALRAQSVAARTFAMHQRRSNLSRYYQVCDTTACQVYAGKSGETPSTNAAVAATYGVILRYNGSPAFTQFSSSSGGWTAKGSAPYLPAKKDRYDNWSGNYVHSWSASISASSVQSRYPQIGTLQKVRTRGRDGNGDWGGRVGSVRLFGSSSAVTVSAETMRFAFGLRSTWFRFR